MNILIAPGNILNFDIEEMADFQDLLMIFNAHAAQNDEKQKYYEGKISINEVNLGIALPEQIRKLQIGCAWGAKTVDVLAARSMFDGFVGLNGADIEELDEIVINNDLITAYSKATRDELKLGASFATLSGDPQHGVKIRFHSEMSAAAKWDGSKNRIKKGFAVIDTEQVPGSEVWSASVINYYTDDAIWVLTKNGSTWNAEKFSHKMGRPLMEALTWNATSEKPFGRSRIKQPIRDLIDGYIRTMANASIGLEFATSPQKYILGVTDEQYDQVVTEKFKQYVGNILATTTNPETGEKPSFGQLQQGTIQPHIDMMRMLATQYSAATGLTVTDTGVVNDANPSSSDAIEAQTKTLVGMAEELNRGNGAALRNIAMMALAIKNGKRLEELTQEQKAVVAHFKNPAMPSIASTTDAAIKIAAARPGFASTDTFLEMIGFDIAEIRRIKNQEAQARGLQVLTEFEE